MNRPAAFGLIRSVILSYLVSTGGVLLLSWALYVMKWEGAGSILAVRVLYFLSCFAGGFLAGKEFRQNRLLWSLLTGMIYGMILFLVSQLTGGPGSASWFDVVILFLICLIGSGLGSICS